MSAAGSNLKAWAAHEVVPSLAGRRAVAIAAFVVATALGAYASVPLTPVPITLQPLVVILAGALLGPMMGAAAMSAYLVIGALGVPVFSGGGAGLPWLLGPTGGYLIAYPAAAMVVGWIAGRGGAERAVAEDRGTGAARLTLALAAGVAVMYIGGVSQLALLTGEGLANLLAVGVFPFVVGDLIKIAIALLIAGKLRPKTLDRVGSGA